MPQAPLTESGLCDPPHTTVIPILLSAFRAVEQTWFRASRLRALGRLVVLLRGRAQQDAWTLFFFHGDPDAGNTYVMTRKTAS